MLDNTGHIADFSAGNNNSALFKFETKMTGGIGHDGTKDVKIMILLKYLSKF